MSTPYVYSLQMPSSDPGTNRRLGFRMPRSILLPPYLALDQYFVDYVDSQDAVFGPNIDDKIDIIANIRNMWVTNPDLENGPIANHELIPFDSWSQPEREILVKQVNLLGMKLQNAGVLSNDAYHTVARFVGQYWFQKGTQSFIDFINFCLSASLQVTKLWSQDYVTFVAEGDPSIGTAIWDGGPWFPTTHVSIVAAGGLQQLDIQTLVSFFYEIANYNLVLSSVDSSYSMPIQDQIDTVTGQAVVVAIGLWADSAFPISNVLRLGADPPPTYDVGSQFPGNALSTNPTNTDYTTEYMMAAPSAWIEDVDGDLIPVYTPQDQLITEDSDLPETLMGGASTTGTITGYNVLYGPVTWTGVPGSSRSKARIPTFTGIPTQRTVDPAFVPSQMIGNLRGNLLVNPRGFKEFTVGSGLYYPYW